MEYLTDVSTFVTILKSKHCYAKFKIKNIKAEDNEKRINNSFL